MNAKVISVFSGAGGMDLGFRQAGFEIVASNEVHPTICKTLKENVKHFGKDHDVIDRSIHLLSIDDLRKDYGRNIDGIVGGFPCIIYSTAADINNTRVGSRCHKFDYKQYAKRGGDLFLHYFRLVALWQPKWFVIENVPGILDAKIVRETFANTPCGDNDHPLRTYYKLYEGILQTQEFGLPQRRPRYFFVGAKRNGPLLISRPVERRKLIVGDILEAENPPDMEIPDYVYRRLAGEYRDLPIITEAGIDAIAPTCVAHYGKDRSTRLIKIGKTIRPYTTREWARLQGFPDDFELEGPDSMKYIQAGNAVPVPVAYSIARGIKELMYN